MSGISLATAEARLSMWLDAEEKIASAQSYQYKQRQFTRADLAEVRDTISYWEKKVAKLSRGGIRITGATPT